MEIRKLTGLIAAPFTPMNSNGGINTSAIPPYAAHLKEDGVKGAFVCGTTGEGMLMTNEERKVITEKWLQEQSEDFKVIVHVGTTSAKQSKELAQHAQQNGAYAIGSMGPVFLQPTQIEELIGYCNEVASGAPDLPFYYYHIPFVSGVTLSMYAFIQEAVKQIPSFAGIKFTHNNFMEMQQCIQFGGGKWDILSGFDEMLLAGLSFGAKGAVGSTFNFIAPLYNQIIMDFESGDIISARKKQIKTVNIIEILIRNNGAIVAGKTLMKSIGIDCGRCRLPLKNLTANEYNIFINDLEKEGFYELMKT
ncbi:MAG: dihydrodipicolinate synthase family protein [Draconibacterium sp.]